MFPRCESNDCQLKPAASVDDAGASGMKAADAPSFERYDEKFDSSTGHGGLAIWIPVRE